MSMLHLPSREGGVGILLERLRDVLTKGALLVGVGIVVTHVIIAAAYESVGYRDKKDSLFLAFLSGVVRTFLVAVVAFHYLVDPKVRRTAWCFWALLIVVVTVVVIVLRTL